MSWSPHVTVAAIVERQGRFLMVEEHTGEGIRLNQPAGHLEAGESLLEAIIRETREETAQAFRPHHLVGIYRWQLPPDGITYLRFCFAGESGCRPATSLGGLVGFTVSAMAGPAAGESGVPKIYTGPLAYPQADNSILTALFRYTTSCLILRGELTRLGG